MNTKIRCLSIIGLTTLLSSCSKIDQQREFMEKSTYNNIIDDNFDSVKNESSSIDNVSEKENKFDNIPVFSLDFPKDIIKKII